MDVPGMPRIRAEWESLAVGSWCEGDECMTTLLETLVTVWDDGTWQRVAYDPRDPIKKRFVQKSSDADATETADEVMTRFRTYAELPAVPAKRTR